LLPPPVKRPPQARFFSVTPVPLCTVPQLPAPIPVVKASSLGFGLKPQHCVPRVVVVVTGVVVVVVVVATGAVVVVVAAGPVVVVVAAGAVVVVAVGAVVVVVAAGAVVVVVAAGAVVVVVAPGPVVVVVVAAGAVVVDVSVATVVVVVSSGGEVVVVLPPVEQPPAPHASQQLDCDPTHAVPPGGAVQLCPSCSIEQVVLPLESVWQQVTKPGLPQVDAAAQFTTASLHAARSSPPSMALFTTCATQLTYLP
jgi:hypothetical protein